MEKLKIGIVGAGRIGNVHAQSITYAIPEAEVAAVTRKSPSRPWRPGSMSSVKSRWT